MKYATIFIFGLFYVSISGQTDYKAYRDSLNISVCGDRDSATLITAIKQLSEFDTTVVGKNLYMYYNDLAMCNWELSQSTSEPRRAELIKTGISHYHKSLHHSPKNTQTLWNLLFSYFTLGDCQKTLEYLALYKHYEKRRFCDKEGIKSIENRCK